MVLLESGSISEQQELSHELEDHKVKEKGHRVLRLKLLVCKNHQHQSPSPTADSIGEEFQTSTDIHIGRKTAEGASWNGFPWPSCCMQASHHQVQYQASDGVM